MGQVINVHVVFWAYPVNTNCISYINSCGVDITDEVGNEFDHYDVTDVG